MFKISFMGLVGSISYDTEALAWRAVHELLEEAFGENYGATELGEYNIVAA
jgi:hypothetical protein